MALNNLQRLIWHKNTDELISDVLLWTPAYSQAKAGRPARTYIQQICEDTGCSPEDLPEAMKDREKWRDRFRDIRSSGTTLMMKNSIESDEKMLIQVQGYLVESSWIIVCLIACSCGRVGKYVRGTSRLSNGQDR